MVSWEEGKVSVTSKVVTGGAATRFRGTRTGTSTGTTGGGGRMAAACAGSIMPVQPQAFVDGSCNEARGFSIDSCCVVILQSVSMSRHHHNCEHEIAGEVQLDT